MIVYKTTNLINGKIYIGKDSKNNIKYYGSGKILKNSIKKYGIENFSKEVLETCESLHDLNIREIYWINFYDSTNREIGYNLAPGGEGNSGKWNGDVLSDKHKSNISKGLNESVKFKKLWADDNHREKLSIARKKSDKVKLIIEDKNWRKKISNSLKTSEKYIKCINSTERGKKISNSMKNSVKLQTSRKSEEFKQKCILREKNNPKSKEWYQERQKKTNIKIAERLQKEKNYLLTLINNTIQEVSLILNITTASVYRKLRKHNIKLLTQ